ncbi:MAG: Pls/PosA family non-ribosomal peptide synthetase [Xanthobacteraceae bacterium]
MPGAGVQPVPTSAVLEAVSASSLASSQALRAPQGTLPRISAEPDPRDDRILICANADNSIRWTEGERLNDLFERRCDELSDAEAVVTDTATYTFRDLDNRANQTAHYLLSRGLKSGDRIGLVFDKTFDTYVALLAVLKINAAYVPLDAGFPNDRITFICGDAGVKTILSLSIFGAKLDAIDLPKIFLDTAAAAIDAQPKTRPTDAERGAPVDQLAYLIYTSGTTGTPKGVAIEHASICNFVRVAADVYGMKPGDRCYQGMTIAFDFSVEELWVPLLAGTTLVPGRPGSSLVGSDLADYLQSKRVTVMCCVPTLLGTIERDLPDLRILLVSGEACPQNLVARWQRPGRIMLNAYGPTEATVTCTLTELYPNKPVTIGGPLPTYSIVILAEDKDEALARGAMGEIAVAGIGLAAGYLNREDLTQKKFIPDFLHIANNPSGRIYRTGDLGRINDNSEVEFHGRIDTQVKIRGYRIELAEIESVLEQMPHVSQAVVNVYEPEPGAAELVAYYVLRQGAQDPPASEVAEKLRKHLPPYMVPAYLERLDVIPMTTSHKADRKALPPPKGQRMAVGSGNFVGAKTPTEQALVGALGDVMKIDRISIADNFFQDLGAHSLLMARFGSEIRKRLNISAVSMRDIYLNPTVEKLAAHLDALPPEAPMQMNQEPIRVPSAFAYYTCGLFQVLAYVGYGSFALWLLVEGLEWVYEAAGDLTNLYTRSAIFGFALFATLTAVPILGKWLLVGRWKASAFPIWGPRYFRFWLVRSLVQVNPMTLFAGSPLYNVYLRLLGMRIGRDSIIVSALVPACTDLISIGDNAVVRRDAILQGYRARSGTIQTGAIHIGNNGYVGEAAVLDIDTAMEDDTQLGHASSLHSGQRVPKGKHFHGSPAQETTADYNPLGVGQASRLRRVFYTIYQMAAIFAVAVPAVTIFGYYLYRLLIEVTSDQLIREAFVPGLITLSAEVMVVSLVLTLALLPFGLIGVYLVPRLFNLFLREDKPYALYGAHHIVSQIVSNVSNSAAYCLLFGDSSYIVYYLKWVVGYRLNKVEQTGANFGLDQRHDNPFLCDIGSGTMVSDGLTMINVHLSNAAFKLGKVKIGDHSYLGNNIHYPADGKTGANCLLGTKVMIPIDGPVRENVGLLGSPSFEIPRSVDRDKNLNPPVDDSERLEALRKKNGYNIRSMIMLVLGNWFFAFLSLLAGFVALLHFHLHGFLSIWAFGLFFTLVGIAWFAVVERASIGFGRLRPQVVSMYDPHFWYHERHWKFCGSPLILLFKGTPLKNFISRLLGVRLGKRVFDDGARFHDKTLIEVGDYVTLNEGCVIQCHSLEEGVFKCDAVRIGNGCTLGSAAFVHYGVTMGENVVLDLDSFLMKGETPDPNSVWRGNPAKAGRDESAAERAAAAA